MTAAMVWVATSGSRRRSRSISRGSSTSRVTFASPVVMSGLFHTNKEPAIDSRALVKLMFTGVMTWLTTVVSMGGDELMDDRA